MASHIINGNEQFIYLCIRLSRRKETTLTTNRKIQDLTRMVHITTNSITGSSLGLRQTNWSTLRSLVQSIIRDNDMKTMSAQPNCTRRKLNGCHANPRPRPGSAWACMSVSCFVFFCSFLLSVFIFQQTCKSRPSSRTTLSILTWEEIDHQMKMSFEDKLARRETPALVLLCTPQGLSSS